MYNVVSASRSTEKTDEIKDYFVQLSNGSGEIIMHEGSPYDFRITRKQLFNAMESKGFELALFGNANVAEAMLIELLKRARISCSIVPKKKGDKFIADEFTGSVIDKNGDRVIPKVGAEYEVQENGYRIDYKKPFSIHLELSDFLDCVSTASTLNRAYSHASVE